MGSFCTVLGTVADSLYIYSDFKGFKILAIENAQLTCTLYTVTNTSTQKKSYMSPYGDRGEHPPTGLVGREDRGLSPNLKFTSRAELSHLRKSNSIVDEYGGLAHK